MKVLHITKNDYLGTGLAVLRIHYALLKSGVDSSVLVYEKRSKEPSVIQYKTDKEQTICFFRKILRRILSVLSPTDMLILRIYHLNKRYNLGATSPLSHFRIQDHLLVQNADIIHLHEIEFLDYPSFFESINKPIIWTLHDLAPMSGIFRTEFAQKKYESKYLLLEKKCLKIKQRAIAKNKNLTLVTTTHYMSALLKKSSYLCARPSVQIPLCIDENEFQIIDRSDARKRLNLPLEKKIILFISVILHSESKGFDLLCQAMNIQNDPNCCLVAVGFGDIPSLTNSQVFQFPPTLTPKDLNIFYSASDLFVLPSYNESFGQTPIEAFLCGIPIVVTPVGIFPEIVDDMNGVLCDKYTPEALLASIQFVLSNKYDAKMIREKVVDLYNPSKIASQYINLYQKEMKDSCG